MYPTLRSNFGRSCAISWIFIWSFQLLLCSCAKCFRTGPITPLFIGTLYESFLWPYYFFSMVDVPTCGQCATCAPQDPLEATSNAELLISHALIPQKLQKSHFLQKRTFPFLSLLLGNKSLSSTPYFPFQTQCG